MINKIINNKILFDKYILINYINDKFIININAIKEINEQLKSKILAINMKL